MVGGLIGPSVGAGAFLFLFRRTMKNMPSIIAPIKATPPTAPPIMAPSGTELFLSSLSLEDGLEDPSVPFDFLLPDSSGSVITVALSVMLPSPVV